MVFITRWSLYAGGLWGRFDCIWIWAVGVVYLCITYWYLLKRYYITELEFLKILICKYLLKPDF